MLENQALIEPIPTAAVAQALGAEIQTKTTKEIHQTALILAMLRSEALSTSIP